MYFKGHLGLQNCYVTDLCSFIIQNLVNLAKLLQHFQHPILARGATEPPQKAIEHLVEVLHWVKEFLGPTGFVAGTDHLTLADIRYLIAPKTSNLINGLFVRASPYVQWPIL